MKKAFVIVVFLMSCKQKKPVVSKLSGEDSIRNSLIGKWGAANNKGEPIWLITRDSMYWYSQKKAYYYSLNGSDLDINSYPFIIHFKNVHVNKDTLFFSDRISLTEEIYGETIAFRHK